MEDAELRRKNHKLSNNVESLQGAFDLIPIVLNQELGLLARGIHADTNGTFIITTEKGEDRTFTAVAGMYYPYQHSVVKAGSTATGSSLV